MLTPGVFYSVTAAVFYFPRRKSYVYASRQCKAHVMSHSQGTVHHMPHLRSPICIHVLSNSCTHSPTAFRPIWAGCPPLEAGLRSTTAP